MPRTTDVAIVAVPVVACLALFAGLGMLNRPGNLQSLALPTMPTAGATGATSPATMSPTTGTVATEAAPVSPSTPVQTVPAQAATAQNQTASAPTIPIQAAPVQTVTTAAPTTAASGSDAAALARGRELSALLYSQKLTPLWNDFTPSVRREWGDFQSFQAYRTGGVKTFGAERRVVSEQVRRSGGVEYYTRTATFERGPERDWTLVFGLNPAGQVVEFNIVAAGVLPGSGQ